MAAEATVACKKGGKTRATLTLVGRSAIAIGVAVFDLGTRIFDARFSLIAFMVSLKSETERAARRAALAE